MGHEQGFGSVPPDEGDQLSIRRQTRPRRAAISIGEGAEVAGFPIEGSNLPDTVEHVSVVLVTAVAGGEVDPAPIGGEGRVIGVGDFVLLGDANAVPAHAVIEPKLHCADAAPVGEPLAPHHVVSVRTPLARVHHMILVGGERARIAAVQKHRPQVVASPSIAGEQHPGAVGGKTRLHVVRDAPGQTPRRAARDGKEIQIAEKVEGDRLAIGRYVDRDPGSLLGIEADRIRGPVSGGHPPGRLGGFLGTAAVDRRGGRISRGRQGALFEVTRKLRKRRRGQQHQYEKQAKGRLHLKRSF